MPRACGRETGVDGTPDGKHTLETRAAPSLSLFGRLQCLSARHISAIDEALVAIGDYGEVRLIKTRGRLRFIQTLKSEGLRDTEEA